MNFIDLLLSLTRMAGRNAARNPGRSLLVAATAAVGISGVLLTVAFMNGFARAWVEGGIESGLGHVQVRPLHYSRLRRMNMRFEHPEAIKSWLSRFRRLPPGVRYAHRFERQGFLRLGGASRGVLVMGVDPAQERSITRFDEWLLRGSYLGGTNKRDVATGILPALLGEANARHFEVDVGETLVHSIGGVEGSVRSARVRVVGIFRSIAEPIDAHTLLLKRTDLSVLYGAGTTELSYTVLLGSERAGAERLKRSLSASNPPAADLLTYSEMQPGITRLLEFTDGVMVLFYGIMLVGFAFVLMNAVLMSVFERSREIGVMRALGARGSLIFSLVVAESVFLGLAGALGGVLLAASVAGILQSTGLDVSVFAQGLELMGGVGTRIHPHIRPSDIWTGLWTSVFVCVVAAAYPALRALRMTPVRAIRGQ